MTSAENDGGRFGKRQTTIFQVAGFLFFLALTSYMTSTVDFETGFGSSAENTAGQQAPFNRGFTAILSGRYGDAIEEFNQIVELNPDQAEAYHFRGYALDKLGDYEQAIADYSKAIKLKPDYADAYLNRGAAYLKVDPRQSLRDSAMAVKLDPDLALLAYLNRGHAHDELNGYEQAIIDYSKVIELDPDYAGVYLKRGISYGKSGYYARAIRDFDKAVHLNPNYESAYNSRGHAYRILGDYEQAIRDFETYLELAPDAPDRVQMKGTIEQLKRQR